MHEPQESDAVIDVHTHLGGVKSWFRALKGTVYVTAAHLLEYMDEAGVQASVVLPTAGRFREVGDDIAQTEEVLEVCAKHPDRLFPFCSVDPRDAMALRKVEKYAAMGCRGFGEHKIELRVDDPRSKKIYKICAELELPVLLHTNNRYNPDIDGYERVIVEFPETIFIAHGPGWWREISGEVSGLDQYPKGKVIPGGKADRILREYPNAYADISANSGLNALQRDPTFTRGFIERNWRKFLFGTDFPCLDAQGHQFGPNHLHANLLRSLNLREEVYRAITHENAESLLRMRT